MTQEEYSQYAIDFIRKNITLHPFSIESKDDGSVFILFTSNRGLLTIWVGTFSKEITMGFEDSEGKSYWHNHMSVFGSNESDRQFNLLALILNNIFSGSEPILKSNKEGYYLSIKSGNSSNGQKADDNIERYMWSEL